MMVNHNVYVSKKAANYNVMVRMHEPLKRTGLSRTYHNFMEMVS